MILIQFMNMINYILVYGKEMEKSSIIFKMIVVKWFYLLVELWVVRIKKCLLSWHLAMVNILIKVLWKLILCWQLSSYNLLEVMNTLLHFDLKEMISLIRPILLLKYCFKKKQDLSPSITSL